MSIHPEVPGTSPRKKRGPQKRDYFNDFLKEKGLSLGSSRTNERGHHIVRKAEELKAKGHSAAAEILLDAMNISIRGTYELTRESDEVLLAYCNVVIAGEARNLTEAKKLVDRLRREKRNEKPVSLLREKNNMYRLDSLRNHSSVLLSAQDLIELSFLLDSIMPELIEKGREDPVDSGQQG